MPDKGMMEASFLEKIVGEYELSDQILSIL
jgi:hypothetical protein